MLALGFRANDMFTDRLTTPAMIAIASSAPPGSAVHHALNDGWSFEAHLLANISEQNANLASPKERYRRPGVVEDEKPSTAGGFGVFDSIAAFEARRAEAFSGKGE